ncbi:hypothetical protein HPP92_011904 [Vanilla planifolia]|uniref:Sister chromatid cohesion protein n=1 Tax=Vanilla planifolia TaxID=51239 RepID=A0A835R7D7_VANPL|nr:hypothetical protein HPP92_012255 [Vanilla planifolia]KAG0483820.1 hypothetical protein HPP92_011904 [Vanilla planifolia]
MLKPNWGDTITDTSTHGPEYGKSSVPVAAGAVVLGVILERCLDVIDRVRESALKIVEIVLRQGDGLQMSFKFIQSIAKNLVTHNARANFDAVAIAHIKQGISRIYRLIRGNRNSRNKFIHSIVRKFESGHGIVPSVSFLHSKQNEMSDMDSISVPSEENLQKFQADWHDSIALQLLLKLKRHLKIVYGLNDEKCQAFSLKEHPKAGESFCRQNVPFNSSDISTSSPTNYGEMLQKYQEFKAALKEDTMDYATYTSSIKRKAPRPTQEAQENLPWLEEPVDTMKRR